MLWLIILCIVLAVITVVQAVKIYFLHKSADEILNELSEKLSMDTNTLLSVNTTDRHIKHLVSELNGHLRLLRDERRRFQTGDAELKQAIINISHDLRTPLTAISGYMELLDHEEKSETVERYLSVIGNRVDAMRVLSGELFRYSVVTSAEKKLNIEDMSLNAALEESLSAHYAMLTEAGIEPVISIPDKQVVRSLDRSAVSRIFANIISNAVKYSDGDLYVTLKGSGEIFFENSAQDLDEVQVGRLFDRFYTVETARNSTGLGLSIARTLTERMNGKAKAYINNGRLCVSICFN